MLAKKYPELKKPVSSVRKISFSERWKHTLLDLQIRHMDQMEEKRMIRQLKKDAREEGLAEGKAEEKIEIARNALKNGFSAEDVQAITGLDADSVKRLI